MSLLDIKNLTLEIDSQSGWIKALDKINLVINEGQIHALVGESGSGKSIIVKAIVGAISDRWRITADRICLLYTSPSPRDRTRSRMPSSA